jgi:hypothetical protein
MDIPYLTLSAIAPCSKSLSTSCSTFNALNRPSIDPPPEASLSGMMEGRSDSVGPNEVIDVEAFLSTHNLFAGNLLFYKKHLCGSVCV